MREYLFLPPSLAVLCSGSPRRFWVIPLPVVLPRVTGVAFIYAYSLSVAMAHRMVTEAALLADPEGLLAPYSTNSVGQA